MSITTPLALVCMLALATLAAAADREADRIHPWHQDARYWQYRGEPVLLIGASDQDNLFNHPHIPPDGLEAHLDRMRDAGGNYVRNTMSSRDIEDNLWPFHRDADTGLYDLDRFKDAYWQRFRDFLDMTAERGIIVQIEIWDRFDFAREPWNHNPFNPRNNTNYSAEESGLPESITTHPGRRENPFFRSLPDLDDPNPELLAYQEALVRKMLDISLEYDHVLYCISNETNDSEQWSTHWAELLHAEAEARGKGIEVTEMWDPWNLDHPMHERTFDRPDRYSFVDVSQNTHQVGQAQWDNLQRARQRVADPPRPVNNVKMYGGRHGGGAEEGQHKLWRNLLGGTASARYHRPGGGIGLNDVTAAHLASLRMVLEHINIFAAEPNLELLHDREDDEAYLAALPGEQYALYFPKGGAVTLDLEDAPGNFHLRWLNVLASEWAAAAEVRGGERVDLTPPSDAPWAAVLVRE